jgi:hypothetical protein
MPAPLAERNLFPISRVLLQQMTEKIMLRLFWTMMLLCAASALTNIWFEGFLPDRLIPTFFILGFANFLIWAPIVAYRFLAKS